jgi:3-hydroxyacyl-[acyl-carrier-protein] dehydratase
MRRWLGIGNLTKQQILQLVAHRDPFLFVDYAIENKIGESVVAVKQLEKEDVPFFRHKQLEFMGQAGCILVKQCPEFSESFPVFVGMKDVCWKVEILEPGCTLYCKAKLKGHPRERFGIVETVAWKQSSDKRIFCSGELWFSFI